MDVYPYIALVAQWIEQQSSDFSLKMGVNMSGTYCVSASPGDIIAVFNDTGEELLKQRIPTKQDFLKRELVGKPITVSEAVKKYGVPQTTILTWIKNGFVSVLERGYRTIIDEADIDYCAMIYQERKQSGIGFRAPLFNEDGLPYKLEHEQLAIYRRNKRLATA